MTSRLSGALGAGSFRPDRLSPATVGAVLLLLLLVAATAVPYRSAYLPLNRGTEETASGAFARVLDELPSGSAVIVAFDAEIGSYPEVAHATRSALRQLFDAGHRLSFVSFGPEGRALAVAEMDRLRRADELAAAAVTDLGFVPGSEAAMARSVDQLEIDNFDLALLVGGSDVGPRTWVEQVQARLGADAIPTVAVAPSLLLPELEPYLDSGQLDALLGNPRDGLAYAAAVPPGEGDAGAAAILGRPPSELPILIGMVTALAVLGAVLVRRFSQTAGGSGARRGAR